MLALHEVAKVIGATGKSLYALTWCDLSPIHVHFFSVLICHRLHNTDGGEVHIVIVTVKLANKLLSDVFLRV